MKITNEQLEAACNSLLDAMDNNGYDVYDPMGEGTDDLEYVGISSSGDIKASLKTALETLGITVEQA